MFDCAKFFTRIPEQIVKLLQPSGKKFDVTNLRLTFVHPLKRRLAPAKVDYSVCGRLNTKFLQLS